MFFDNWSISLGNSQIETDCWQQTRAFSVTGDRWKWFKQWRNLRTFFFSLLWFLVVEEHITLFVCLKTLPNPSVYHHFHISFFVIIWRVYRIPVYLIFRHTRIWLIRPCQWMVMNKPWQQAPGAPIVGGGFLRELGDIPSGKLT